MKTCIFVLCFGITLGFLSCGLEQRNGLNSLSGEDFDEYIVRGIKEHKEKELNVKTYIDSLASLSYLNDQHKAKAILWQAAFYYKGNKLDSATYKNELVFEYNKGKIGPNLVNYYLLQAMILEKKNLYYQSLYYFNKAGELLKRYDIYHTSPGKADVMLLRIGLANKDLKQINAAATYTDAAIAKHQKFSKPSSITSDIYTVKAALFAIHPQLIKDSMLYYIRKASQIPNFKLNDTQLDNINYIFAEYFFNVNQMDSALYYMQQISQQRLDEMVIDEINLLTIYSLKGETRKAHRELLKIQEFMDKKMLTAADSILYLENVIDYCISKKDIQQTQKAVKDYFAYKEIFTNQENLKNINELSTIMDLQRKDNQLEIAEHSLRARNKVLLLISFFLLAATIVIIYLRGKSAKRRLLLENQAVNLKVKLLQSQINPHFLFNTLASIQSLIRLNKTEQSIHFLNRFSDLMRQILNQSRNERSPLEKELNMLRLYVEVQKLRKDNFDMQIHLNEETAHLQEHILLPVLCLQPFVENSILHGFKQIDYRGNIQINIEVVKDILSITIVDNGNGINSALHTKTGMKSHGIEIIRERINLIRKTSDGSASLTVGNRIDGQGVIVHIKIPMEVADIC